jgi:hypothetical protein
MCKNLFKISIREICASYFLFFIAKSCIIPDLTVFLKNPE